VQTVPDASKNEELDSIIEYFGSMVRQIDSSLLDEWEKMRNPNWVAQEMAETPGQDLHTGPADITKNRKSFALLVRNEIFRIIRALSVQDYENALLLLHPEGVEAINNNWNADRFDSILKEYYSTDHSRICTDTPARSHKHSLIQVDEETDQWKVQQILIDPEENNDWGINFVVDLALSRQYSKPILSIEHIGPL
jgi:hypothetical protein